LLIFWLSVFHRLVSLDKTTAWISSYKGNIIRKVVIDDKIQTIKEIPVEIYDMTLTKSNNLTEDRIPNDLEMFSSPGTSSCISGRNFVKDKSDTLPPCSLAAGNR
jgi:hypothetical protein